MLHLARLGATLIAPMRNFDGGKRPEAKILTDHAEREGLDLHVVEIDVLDNALIASGAAQAKRSPAAPMRAGMTRRRIGFRKNRVAPQKSATSVAPRKRSRPDDHLFYQIRNRPVQKS